MIKKDLPEDRCHVDVSIFLQAAEDEALYAFSRKRIDVPLHRIELGLAVYKRSYSGSDHDLHHMSGLDAQHEQSGEWSSP